MSARSSALQLFTCAVMSPMTAQVQWSYFDQPSVTTDSRISRGGYVAGGELRLNHDSWPGNNHVRHELVLTPDGDTIDLVPQLEFISQPIPRPNGGHVRWKMDQAMDGSISGIVRLVWGLDQNLERTDTITVPIGWFGWETTVVSQTDEFVMFLAIRSASSASLNDRLVCIRSLNDTDASTTAVHTGEDFVPVSVQQTPNGFRSLFFRSSFPPEPGLGKIVSFDAAFNVLSSYALPCLDGEPTLSWTQDSLFFAYGGYLADDGSAVMHGMLSDPSSQRACLMRTDANGILVGSVFAPVPATTSPIGLAKASDGTFIWSCMEESLGPMNRLHVYRLSPELEIIGHHVADGYMDGTFYQPLTSFTTPDDGLVIAGYYVSFLTSEYGNAFAIKFAMPVGQPETAQGSVVINVYPSPAFEHLTIATGDASFSGGRFLIFDLEGRILINGPLQHPSTRIDISGLWPGLYTVTVRDTTGGKVSSSTWVKY